MSGKRSGSLLLFLALLVSMLVGAPVAAQVATTPTHRMRQMRQMWTTPLRMSSRKFLEARIHDQATGETAGARNPTKNSCGKDRP